MANYRVTYQLPDLNKYLHYDVEADTPHEAIKIFKALMPSATMKGQPQRARKK
jgi:hypothetical protein